jgi:hypothetical protein
MLGDVTPFPFDVQAPASTAGKNSFIVTVNIPLEKEDDAKLILSYMRSIQLKQDLISGWASKNLPDCGMEVVGGPRPVFAGADPADRTQPVISYAQDFRFTRRI